MALDGAAREVGTSLRVMLQVDTSGEETKGGIAWQDVEAVQKLLQVVRDECPALWVGGLMTIGRQGDLSAFARLQQLRERLKDEHQLELSMGMTADFVEAIEQGSDEVRVGTAIFGARVLD